MTPPLSLAAAAPRANPVDTLARLAEKARACAQGGDIGAAREWLDLVIHYPCCGASEPARTAFDCYRMQLLRDVTTVIFKLEKAAFARLTDKGLGETESAAAEDDGAA